MLHLARLVSVFLIASSFAFAADAPTTKPSIELKSTQALPLRKGANQIVLITGAYRGTTQPALVKLDNQKIGDVQLAAGGIRLLIPIATVEKETKSTLVLEAADGTCAQSEITRKPVSELTIFIVPHSHVDIGYTQLQPEIEKKQVNNLISALAMIDKTRTNPEGSRYRWTIEASWTIDNLLRDKPEQLEAMKSAVKAKDMELDAAFGNLLTGLCRPEELMRSYAWGGKYGQQFGVPVKAAMISDVPGYTWGTITALAAADVKYFSIGPNFLDRIGTTLVAWEDRPFYWISPDGRHKVLCWTSYKGYAWSHFVKRINEGQVAEYIDHLAAINYPYDLTYIRWSGHGDNAVPDAGLIGSVKEWNEKYDWPKLKIATVSEPFEKLEAKYADKIPTATGDWTPYWEDGAGSSALETAMNRATDERLVAAETLFAMLKPASEFPADRFRSGWRGTMLYSEHTWGAHCSISEPEDPLTTGQWAIKRGYATAADAISRKLLDESVASGAQIANAIDVFNTSTWPRTGIVTVAADQSKVGDRVSDEKGNAVASQRLSTGELAVAVDNIPAMASRRFVISAGPAKSAGDVKTAECTLENSALKVAVDPSTGNVTELSRNGYNFAQSGGLNDYIYIEADKFDAPKRPTTSPSITITDPGPLVATMLIESDAPGCNKLTRQVRLTSAADHVELSDLLDKKRADVKPVSKGGKPQDPANGKEAIHFAFPFNIPNPQVRMDIPFAVAEPEKDQMPGACKNWFTVQRFVDVSNDERGVTWSPIDTPLVQLGGITATLIGSQTNPDVWQKHAEASPKLYSWAMNNYWHTNYRAYQEGPTTFRYSIRPHGVYEASDSQKFGQEQSQPLVVVPARDRKLPNAPQLDLKTNDVTITTFKPTDDGKGYILRLFASAGKATQVPLQWKGPAPAAVYQSNSFEQKGQKLTEPVQIPAWGVTTLRIE